MNELQTLESIIAGKPESMSYFAQLEAPVNKDIYLDDCMMINEIAIFSEDDNKFIAVDSDSVCIDAIINMRSLADIQKQIDQLKEIDSLREQLASELSINKNLHSLMVSGEKRGIKKATEDFKEQLASSNELLKECRTMLETIYKNIGSYGAKNLSMEITKQLEGKG